MQSCVLDIKHPKQYAFHQNKYPLYMFMRLYRSRVKYQEASFIIWSVVLEGFMYVQRRHDPHIKLAMEIQTTIMCLKNDVICRLVVSYRSTNETNDTECQWIYGVISPYAIRHYKICRCFGYGTGYSRNR